MGSVREGNELNAKPEGTAQSRKGVLRGTVGG